MTRLRQYKGGAGSEKRGGKFIRLRPGGAMIGGGTFGHLVSISSSRNAKRVEMEEGRRRKRFVCEVVGAWLCGLPLAG